MFGRNRPIVLAIALFAMATLAYGCQIRDGSLPTEANRSLASADLEDDIYDMIDALMPKGLANAASAQFKNVVKDYAKSPAQGIQKAETLMDFIFKHYQNGKWTGAEDTGELIAAIAAYVGLIPDAAAAVACVPNVDCELRADAGDEFAAGLAQGDMIPQPFIWYLVRLPDDFADPPLFPLFYEINTIPAGITFPSSSPSGSLSLAQADDHPFAVVCALDEFDPLGVPEDAVPGSNLFLAHFENGEWVPLPYVEPPTGFLDCADASSETESALWMRPFAPVLALLSPTPLQAGGRGLGGAISSFSPFGAIYEGQIPTTTTVSIVQEATTFTTGESITIEAVVTPAPPNDETPASIDEGDPVVVFNLATVGPPGKIEPVVDGTAEHTYYCGEGPEESTVVPYGSHTGGAAFLGTATHALSVSGQVLAFDCNESGE